MKVLVDVEKMRDPNSGLGQLCRWLGAALICARPVNAALAFLAPPGAPALLGPTAAYETANWWRRIVPLYGYDVWHATHQDSPFPRPRGSRMVLTIHDLNFLERADYSAVKKQRRLDAVQRRIDDAAAITTVSHYTESVVREHLSIPDIPVRPIYHGNPLEAAGAVACPPAADSPLAPLVAGAPFLLSVGVLHPKKNLHTLVPMIAQLPGLRLVLAGADGHAYATRLREDSARLGLTGRVIVPGPVDEGTKRWLYEHCRALVFPSLSEGFGLPAIEAMSHGKPVFLSRLTSLPEIGGDDAYYFDSFDAAAMAQTIRDGLRDLDAHPGRIDRLRARAAQFTWERAAREYWSVYEAAASGRGASTPPAPTR